ncbi:CTU2 [[Candida] subhashii]|uniref:Cytoplasmic tRNA 2-thiolation protein 2 n=1 Tax=[Candida] subhashii TaxID=561895 RepID=A0A8J5QQ53_9ASCO|nr:CTU2 [[Candida] subhashii]KAG7663487.1 CTU2 [[Candida] subhashii]
MSTPNQAITYLDSEESTSCQRCKTTPAILISRKEKFCQNCFIRFIRGKQRKQMQDDQYKVKYGPLAEKLGKQKVLLALSGGRSSLVLLDVIASLLQEQYAAHKGNQGFELVIVNLDEYELDSLNKKVQDVIPELLERYNPVKLTLKVLSLNSYVDQGTLQKISLNHEFTGFISSINNSKEYTLSELLDLCPSKSSAEDLLTIVYEELILRTAYKEGCQTVIYGHSMTRIANEIIALTVKGRGSIIHKAIADHTEKYLDKEIKVLFPLRDVLYAEILAYCELADLNKYLIESTIQKSKITKNLTIRDITTNYFKQLDATGYASTASTVVRTGEKLGAPKDEQVLAHCQVCGVEIYRDPREWLRRITVNDPAPVETEEEREYVELYKRTFGTGQEGEIEGDPVSICYGCIVTLGGVKQESGFVWPIKSHEVEAGDNKELQWIYRNDEQEKQKILDEFILSDEEDV